MDAAELVLRGGVIVTNDPARPRAAALAVRAGRIAAVGDVEEVARLVGPGTRVVELGGRAVLPALTDAHAHLYGLGRALAEVDLRGCASPDECAARVAAAARERPPGEWILGRGWDQNRFPDRRFPTHEALDRAAPNHPVWVRRVDGHAGWANARALQIADIGGAKDPPGGRIERDRAGRPTGVLVDGAMGLVERAVPPEPKEARERAILRAQAVALENGLTAVHEMGIDETTAAAYRHLAAGGRLALRVYAFADGGDGAATERLLMSPPERGDPEVRFAMRGIKLYADGALGSRGAALLAPYSDDPGNVGLVITSAERIERLARVALAHGWQLAVHAIGDRGNRLVLDAFERAGATKKQDHRFRIEHAQIVDINDIPRFARMGVIASMQPTHATSDMPWAEARLGKERLAGAYAWRRFLDAGARLAFGSDFPVEEVDPIGGGLWSAATRQDGRGQPPGGWLPSEKLDTGEAVRAFTAGAAYAAFEEEWRGRAAVGQVADLTILSRDIFIDVSALRAAHVDMTIVGGRVAWERTAPVQ